MTDDTGHLEQDAVELASRAIQFDREGQVDPAVFYYREAAQILHSAFLNGSQLLNIKEKVKEYLDRAETLIEQKNADKPTQEQKNVHQQELERAQFLLHQAFDEDSDGNKEEAVKLYSQAVELCLKARKQTQDATLQKNLTKLAEQALERAEALKGVKDKKSEPSLSATSKPVSPLPSRSHAAPPLGIGSLSSNTSSSSHQTGPQVCGRDTYTKEELEVLRLTSVINGREYVPFMFVDLRERFAYPLPFSDKDGRLTLSHKQKNSFSKWVRPEDISANPKLIEVIDCFSIKQTIVSDCSFVASLAISALYEKRFKRRIITSIIYPQNRQGEPVYNPCGKYVVKLHINGVRRKVVIDDKLPLGRNGELLCSYSNNCNEFWVSLLEKSYMKVMGGYDFPGSNSNIDLHALTGWIPERIPIRPNDSEFNKENVFKMLFDRHHKGDVLATMATGEMSDREAERTGLVPTHAYAMLDVREIMGKQLFLLKNPWSHVRWKGNFSELDTRNWTPKLQEALKYDPRNAKMFDNGVFWIDYESICRFYDIIYLNWNPTLFKYTFALHQTWKAGAGPVKDLYNIGENPQYSLETKGGGCAVWILLTRHITDRDDFADNKEYITVLVYKNEGKKVYYPYDPAPFIDGVRINSPHCLCKLIIPSSGPTRYTLVVSQYEKMNTIHYTLRAYSSVPFQLNKISNPFKFKQEIKNGEWTEATAGGCGNHPLTYPINPIYQISLQSISDENQLLIDLKGPKQYAVGFDVVTVSVNNTNASGYFPKKSSGAFRSGFSIMELLDVPCGVYNIIPCTFHPGQKGPFFLTVEASCHIKISRLR